MDPYATHSSHECMGSPHVATVIKPLWNDVWMSILNFWFVFDEDTNTLLKHIIDLGRFQKELWWYGEQILLRPQEDVNNPQVELGNQVLVKIWQEKVSPS